MDTKDWISALGLALQYPVLLVAAVVIFSVQHLVLHGF